MSDRGTSVGGLELLCASCSYTHEVGTKLNAK